MDPQEAVDQLFGAGRAKVVDAVTSTRVTEREIILVNGVPVQLVGEDGEALKEALLAGKLPDQSILNRVLASVLGGELKGVSKLESTFTMTSKTTTKDTMTVHHNGKIVDERTAETRSQTQLTGHSEDTFPPGSTPSIFSSSGNSRMSCSSSPSSLSSSPRPSQSPSPRPPSRATESPTRMTKSQSPLNCGQLSSCSSPVPMRTSRSSSSSRTSIKTKENGSGVILNQDLVDSLARTGLTDLSPCLKNGDYIKLNQVQNVSTYMFTYHHYFSYSYIIWICIYCLKYINELTYTLLLLIYFNS